MGCFTGCEQLGEGWICPTPHSFKDNEWSDKKKYEVSIFSMGNLEQISTSVYPSKNYSKYPKSTLEHKWFLSKMLFCRSSVLRNLRFLAKKTLRSRKKGHLPWYFLILSNFCFMTTPQKMPLSTLKSQFSNLRFLKKGP